MLKHFIFTWRLKLAIAKAKQMHSITKKQYYVFQWKSKPRVFSAVQLRELRKRNRLKINWMQMQEVALFKTA